MPGQKRASLSFMLFGIDAGASRSIRGVGDAAHGSAGEVAALARSVGKFGAVAGGASVATLGLAGAAGVGLAAGLAAGAAAIAATTPQVKNSFASLGKDVLKSLQSMSGPVQDSLIGLSALLRQTFNELRPTFRALFSALAPIVTQFGTGLVKAIVPLIKALPELLKVVQPLVDVFTASLVPITTALVQALKNVLGPAGQNARAFGELFKAVAALLPLVGTLLGVLVRLGGFLVNQFSPVLVPLAGVILGIAAAVKVWAFWTAVQTKGTLAYVAAQAVAKVATLAWTAAQWLLNAALTANPLGVVIVAVAALAGGIIYAYRHSAQFRRVVQDVWEWLKRLGAGLVEAARFVATLGGKLLALFTAAAGWLVGAGRRVLSGFLDGLKAAWEAVKKWFLGIPNWIKAHKGPLSLDRGLLVPAGRAIMTGFLKGLKSGAGGAMRFVAGIVGDIWGALGGILGGGLPRGGSIAANVNIGRLLAGARGWVGAQWEALFQLFNNESGWNNWARNPSSGAFGIPQALPPGKMGAAANPPRADAAAQIFWGLNYIQSRYGSPLGAWAAWLSRSPHWYAGGLDPTVFSRPTLIGVGEAGPEVVSVTPGRGRGGGDVHVHFHGPVFGGRDQVAAELAPGVRLAIRKAQRQEGVRPAV